MEAVKMYGVVMGYSDSNVVIEPDLCGIFTKWNKAKKCFNDLIKKYTDYPKNSYTIERIGDRAEITNNDYDFYVVIKIEPVEKQ